MTAPPKLMPVYTTSTASAPVQLYAGPINIRQGTYTGMGSGVINLVWRVLGPEVRFQVPSLLPVDFLNTTDCLLSTSSFQREVPVFLSEVTLTGGTQGPGIGVCGQPHHNIVTGTDQPVSQVLFHVVNFWHYLNPRPDPVPIDYDVGRVVFEGGGWRVVLQGVNRARELEEQARRNSGFAITHAGQAERLDGGLFTRLDAQQLFQALHSFLSFTRGLWSPPILFVGVDSSGTHPWHDWTVLQGSPGHEVFSWFPRFQPGCLAAIFPGFMNLWQNPDIREILEVAIHWYIEANLCSGAIEGAVILCQTGLERLAYYIMVHDRGLLQERDFQPGGLSAAERLRRLFNEFGLPVAVGPIRLRINTLPSLATTQNWTDAPDGFVRLRNSIVHPDQRNLQRLQNFPLKARREAWTLCLWYYEVILLKWFGYSGQYVNRQTVVNNGDTEQLP